MRMCMYVYVSISILMCDVCSNNNQQCKRSVKVLWISVYILISQRAHIHRYDGHNTTKYAYKACNVIPQHTMARCMCTMDPCTYDKRYNTVEQTHTHTHWHIRTRTYKACSIHTYIYSRHIDDNKRCSDRQFWNEQTNVRWHTPSVLSSFSIRINMCRRASSLALYMCLLLPFVL